MDTNNLSTWLDASISAFYDFGVQNFFIEEHSGPQINYLNLLDEIKDLNGSSIELNMNGNKVNVFFLSRQETLDYIAKRILCNDENEQLDAADVVDAINELTNIIAGGVKNRLSAEVEGEILLGLPSCIDKCFINEEQLIYTLGRFNFDNRDIYILIEKISLLN